MLRTTLMTAVAAGALGTAAFASGGQGPIINDQLNATPITGIGSTIISNPSHRGAQEVIGATEATGNIVSMELGGIWADNLSVANNQLNGHGIEATNYTEVRDATRANGFVQSSAAARANVANYDIRADRPTSFVNNQESRPVGNTVPHAFRDLPNINNTIAKNTTVTRATGSVSGSAVALDNLATISMRGQVDQADNFQYAEQRNTRAYNTANVGRVRGDVDMQAVATQNLFSADIRTDAAHFAPKNAQTSWRGRVIAGSSVVARDVTGDVSNLSDASANVYNLELRLNGSGAQDAALNNAQKFFGMVKSDTFVSATDVQGDVNNTTLARANVYNADVRGAEHVTFHGYQSARNDPRASSVVNASNIGGDLNNLTLASANTTDIRAPGAGIIGGITNRQLNQAVTSVNSSVSATNIAGNVSNISSAIGNSFSFSNRAGN